VDDKAVAAQINRLTSDLPWERARAREALLESGDEVRARIIATLRGMRRAPVGTVVERCAHWPSSVVGTRWMSTISRCYAD